MILVTGATGMIGSRLLFDLVSAGNYVRALKRPDSNMVSVDRLFSSRSDLLQKVEWVTGDVNDAFSLEDAMQGVDEIYHSAAFISFHKSDRAKMMKVNIEGTANMVNIAMKTGVKRFCHISSVAAIGRSSGQNLIDENSWWKTSRENSNYAISKYGGEREVWRAMEEGLSAFIISPTIVIGPGDWLSGSTQMFSQVNKGLMFYTRGSTGFVDVRDVSSAAIALMAKGVSNERYIINSENAGYRYVFDLIAENLGKKKSSIEVGKTIVAIGWRAEALLSLLTGKKSMITRETARNGLMNWEYSNEKIKKELGINFISVKESIAETSKYFMNELKKN